MMVNKFYLVEPASYASFLGTNLLSEYANWSAGTSYVAGNRVAYYPNVYEALLPSSGIDPSTDTTGAWGLVGALNWLRLYDGVIGFKSIAVGTDEIQLTITDLPTSDTVVLFGLEAYSVRVLVEYRDGVSAALTTLYDRVENLVDNSAVVDAWTYLNSPIQLRTEMLFENLPIYPVEGIDSVLTKIFITAEDSTPAVGEVVVGKSVAIGKAQTGGSIGITDYSRKERDVFGTYEVVPRTYSDWVEYSVSLDSAKANFVKRLLASRRSLPTAYHCGRDGVDFGLTAFGFFDGLDIDVFSNPKSQITLRIEGLT